MSQLTKLAQPFPKNLIEPPAPGSHGEYINHAIINQRLLEIVGSFNFRIIRELYDGERITGAVCELEMIVDGRTVIIQEIGDNDDKTKKGTDEFIEKTNGERLKKASSDAFKRCAMRAGVGLHLWSKGQYFLHDKLKIAADGGES